MTVILACVLSLGACVSAPAGAVGPDSFAPLVKRVLPAVVNIAVTESVAPSDPFAALPPELQKQFRDRFSRRRQEMQGAGSGFIIDPSGIIVTNNHVVGQADKIVVALSDGTELPARVLGSDDLTDVAVIKVDSPRPLPFVTWGDSNTLEVGDWVIAAGNPFGLGGSITAGIVSARGRDIGAGPFDDFIQIDAPINPGNSGGPVFNNEGRVIGVNTAIVSPTGGSVGIGFAIPSLIASTIVNELRARGAVERGWLGVTVEDRGKSAGQAPGIATPGTTGPGIAAPGAAASGVVIGSVDKAGPAARAGLRQGDMLLSVNGARVDSARGLIKAVAAATPGDSVKLLVLRQGREMDVSVTVGRRPKGQG